MCYFREDVAQVGSTNLSCLGRFAETCPLQALADSTVDVLRAKKGRELIYSELIAARPARPGGQTTQKGLEISYLSKECQW